MAISDPIAPPVLDSVVENLKGFFPAPSLITAEKAETPHVIAESLQVWSVPLERFRASLLDEASWNKVWHHQIGRAPGKAEAYARSWEDSPEPVRGVFRSPLAEELDRAIDAVDENPRFADDHSIVRLLTIPELDFTAVWVAANPSILIPLGRFARPGRLHFEPMTAAELREYLSEEKAIIGLG